MRCVTVAGMIVTASAVAAYRALVFIALRIRYVR